MRTMLCDGEMRQVLEQGVPWRLYQNPAGPGTYTVIEMAFYEVGCKSFA